MDDKELIKRTRNSLKAKKSRAEILRGFQAKGYKLEYAEKIIQKANKPKKIAITLGILLIIIALAATTTYSLFLEPTNPNTTNPLSGFSIITGKTISNPQTNQQTQTPKTIQEIEITPEYISFLLSQIGILELHRNPLTLEKPIINFKIGDQTFSTEISKEVKTKQGLSTKADLQFNTNKEIVIKAIQSQDPKAALKDSIDSGGTQVIIKASQPELFSKGYLNFYNSLK